MDLTLILLLLAGIVAFFVFLYFVPVNLWITAIFSGVKIGLLELVFMRIRKVPPSIVVNSLITATKAGIIITDETGGNNVKRSLKASAVSYTHLTLPTKA